MAISVNTYNSTNAIVGSATPSFPNGTVSGDLILAYVTARAKGEPTITFPDGWTQRAVSTLANSIWSATWHRVFVTGDGNPQIGCNTPSPGWGVSLIGFRGVNTSQPFAVDSATFGNKTASDSCMPGGVTPICANAMAVSLVATADNNALMPLSYYSFDLVYQWATTNGDDHAQGCTTKIFTSAASETIAPWYQTNLGPDGWSYVTDALRPDTYPPRNFSESITDVVSDVDAHRPTTESRITITERLAGTEVLEITVQEGGAEGDTYDEVIVESVGWRDPGMPVQTILNRTIVENMYGSDVSSPTVSHGASITERVSGSDAAKFMANMGASVIDRVSGTDATKPLTDLQISLTDRLATADILGTNFVFPFALVEKIAKADAVTVDLVEGGAPPVYEIEITDAMSFLDQYRSPIPTGNVYSETVVERFAVCDASAYQHVASFQVVEGIRGGENLRPAATSLVGLVEATRLLDTITSQLIKSMTFSESAGVVDAVATSSIAGIPITEGVSASDRIAALLSVNFPVTDIVALVDSVATAIVLGKEYDEAVTEAISASDAIKMQLLSSFLSLDSISVSDLLRAVLNLSVRVEDSAALSEVLDLLAQTASELYEVVTEAISAREAVKAQLLSSFSALDSVSVADLLRAILGLSVRLLDRAALSDVLDLLAITISEMYEEITERVAAADQVKVALQQYVAMVESLAGRDLPVVVGSVYSRFTDSVAGRDLLAIASRFANVVKDSVAVDDPRIVEFFWAVAASECISVTETAKDQFDITIQITDQAALGDAVRMILALAMGLTDNLTAGEVLVMTKMGPTIVIRRGKTFAFSVETVRPQTGVGSRTEHKDRKIYH